jgi:phage gpG-like protein
MGLREDLLRRLAASKVARILVKQAQRRIRERGRDIGGYAALWADTARLKIGKGKKARFIDHYRKGGVPLYDTGDLFRSLTAEQTVIPDGVKLTLKGPLHAMYHQHGFKTSGPNRIPFTRRAARGDAKGKGEALYAKRGVTVPARPIFAMPIEARREVARAIARALGAR